jgi:hypothetical protein
MCLLFRCDVNFFLQKKSGKIKNINFIFFQIRYFLKIKNEKLLHTQIGLNS